MSLKDMIQSHSNGTAGNLLKGSDVPARTKSFVITIQEVREAPPEFNAPFILEFKQETFGAKAWAVNKTNAKAIIKLYGDNEAKLKNKKLRLDVIAVRNPQNGQIVPSLAVSPRQ